MIGQNAVYPTYGGPPDPSNVPHGPAAGAVGPELQQQQLGRASLAAGLESGGVSSPVRLDGSPTTLTFRDLAGTNPQTMPSRPLIRVERPGIEWNVQQAWSSLPGRRIGSSWDGEPGSHEPFPSI